MADFVKAARTTAIEPDQARLVEVKGKQIALFNVNSKLFALDNTPALTAAGLSLMERCWGTK
jgi:nitrite reductase/ring-hydroxylating ferredoxin subunit